MTSGHQDLAGDTGLRPRRYRHVHHFDVVVGEQVVEVSVDAVVAVALGDGSRPVVVKVGDADDPETTTPIGGEVGYVHDDAGADDGNALALVRRNVDPASPGNRPEQVDHGACTPRP